MRFLLDHWHGRLPLAQAFWINLVLVSVVLCVAEYLLHMRLRHSGTGYTGISIGCFLLFHGVIFTWQTVGVLRTCDHNIRHYVAAGWTRAAQFAVLTTLTATLVWGVTLGQTLWKIEADNQQAQAGTDSAPGYRITHGTHDTLAISGTISPGLTRELERTLAQHPEITLIDLNSRGGNIFEARGIARLVREYALDTRASVNCFSSCTTAFIAGRSRSLAQGAKLGFHQYRLDSDKLFAPYVDTGRELQKDRDAFLDQGVSRSFLDRAFSTPHHEMWLPEYDELLEAGVINR